MIKIIAGEFRGRLLETPKGHSTRPTMSQTRACVFNICQQFLSECTFLDICAGSGSMGLEAISRGAARATFIERDREAIKAIRHNIQRLGVEEKSELLCQEALAALESLARRNQTFDICYFDPPYGLENRAILSFLGTQAILKEGAFFFMEESTQTTLDTSQLEQLTLQSKRRIGNTLLYCFRQC
jgi:16S rRNA (guanine966-N2)-methyltransferase